MILTYLTTYNLKNLTNFQQDRYQTQHIRSPPYGVPLAYSRHVEDTVKNKTQKSTSRWFYYTVLL
jgi:hypothetical protein